MDVLFRKYLDEAVGHENAAVFLYALNGPASVSVRLNPWKAPRLPGGGTVARDESVAPSAGHGTGVVSERDVGRFFGCAAGRVPWCPYGFTLDRRPEFVLDPVFHAGGYYVQDSSAMFVGDVFRKILDGMSVPGCDVSGGASGNGLTADGGRVVRVLDLCAAPGGKTTDLATSLRERFGDGFLLVANEVIADRARVLAENVAKWGDPCVMVTCADPAAFRALPGFFDAVVADVPCSGEGMFRKDEGARRQWSVENVALCRARQRRIVGDVWPSLRKGGAMVYSTCTFNRQENEENVEWIAGNLGAEELEIGFEGIEGWKVLRTGHGVTLLPGLVPGEGQFCAALRKAGEGGEGGTESAPRGGRGYSRLAGSEGLARGLFHGRQVELSVNGRSGTVVAVPGSVAADVGRVRDKVRVLRAGCAVGSMMVGGRNGDGRGEVRGSGNGGGTYFGRGFVPAADLALSAILSEGAFPEVDVDLETALRFLHGDSLALHEAPKGFLILVYKCLRLGFVKNVGSRCNNLLPQGRRIRIDVGGVRGMDSEL